LVVVGFWQWFAADMSACHPPAGQVLDEMVQLLTEPKYQGKLVVVLAGYEAQVGAALAGQQDDGRCMYELPA
jgi:hypothetical protein